MSPLARQNFLIIVVLGLLEAISPFAIDLYLPAFPQIAAALQTTPANVSLSLSSYFVGLAIGQLIYGPVLDRYGRKHPLYIGLFLFIVASIGCMMAQNVETMIAFRFLQALGGCAAQVAATAMVRDFFPVNQSAKIFSLMMLILGVSPLLAPTVGTLITLQLGWQWIFLLLTVIVTLIAAAVFFLLPEGHTPDPAVSLRPGPVFTTFLAILRQPQFYTYAFAGAFSFAGLLAYVAGSSIIFMDGFHVDAKTYSLIFAVLATGFIGSSQFNIWLTKRFSFTAIFQAALYCQMAVVTLFMLGVLFDWYDMYATIALLFACLACLGIAAPNSAALALAPFARNAGSASALLGSVQIGVSAIASTGIAIFHASDTGPVVAILWVTTLIGVLILLYGKRRIGTIQLSAEGENALIAH